MSLDLPSTFLLQNRLQLDELHELEDKIGSALTHDISEAKLVIGKIASKQRAILELRSRKVWTDEVVKPESNDIEVERAIPAHVITSPSKRRRVEVTSGKQAVAVDPNTETEDGSISPGESIKQRSMQSPYFQTQSKSPAITTSRPVLSSSPISVASSSMVPDNYEIEWGDTIKVVKLAWFEKSLEVGHPLPIGDYLVYEGKLVPSPEHVSAEPIITKITKRRSAPEEILARAAADAPTTSSTPFLHKKKYGHGNHQSQQSQTYFTRPTHLLHQTTSEHDNPNMFPPMPDWLHTTYSCQRPTPLYSPNDPFISQLKKIKQARELKGDQIGIRAYSTAIASLAAYPYTLTSAHEVLRLPGCGDKYVELFQEWKETGHCQEADELDNDMELKTMNLFWNIWGVGATTARLFWKKGWRDLDDIIEWGWNDLKREQQIGVKFYDEFLVKIPRVEVESIAAVILAAAQKLHPGFQICIVGGYRRGKPQSGDVDVILSHPDENITSGFVEDIVDALEKSQHISHTLKVSLANSERGQTPVSWKGNTETHGSGFDTLDKALVVWQDPNWPSRVSDLAANPKGKNPNIHRRVDILVSPWKTFGCAVLGWTSGTTFQRDLRRYCRKEKNLKFDSSGIRSREDGRWIDFEAMGGRAPDYLTGEKRIFEGLGLEWREPEMRNTG